ncbi:hypothetical protein JCM21531_3415 [Acetivibrio straminisolvens JCM 21531]|uniref:Uncharacterized protein n=1 Tax=Acetivibrio straminisolvens JCM 21531 TaxID=1294263 RepID=W4VAS0_9FIRM|nr:hypothetical protein JCM21531_3415 [Acetivibrio straminisolvens JCM 21531]
MTLFRRYFHSLLYILKHSPAYIFVEGCCICLYIDIHSINIGKQRQKSFLSYKTVSHQNVGKTFFSCKYSRIIHELIPHGRFIVGICNPNIAFRHKLLGFIDNVFGCYIVKFRLIVGNHPILAKRTFEIAAKSTYRQYFRTTLKSVQRLLFYRI